MTLLRILFSLLAGSALGAVGLAAAFYLAAFAADHWPVAGHNDGGAGMAGGMLVFAVLSVLLGIGGFCFAFLRCWRASSPTS